MDHGNFAPLSLRVENLWVVKGGGLFMSPRAILQDVSFCIDLEHFAQ
jgi:hypothetical protein